MRADLLLVARGLFGSRAQAQAAIAAGLVSADGRVVGKPSDNLPEGARIDARPAHPWVSRGGVKLEAALRGFSLAPAGLSCLDVGASTGGFTDVLLAHGAARVLAVDTGHGQLHPRLARDARVDSREGCDIRRLEAPDPAPAFIVIDVSFISLSLVLPSVTRLAAPAATLVALVKPQFEVGRARLGKGGVVRDESARMEALARVEGEAAALGWTLAGRMESPVTGGDGNVEYLIAARR
jgi:23S rRNA (cytidine1920-2'-O)/16S rRNA (cytidine1409-2'-O)-methyltransferase